jgi:hypothetical protein
MRLPGIDGGLQARKELARELGHGGDTGDSAAMNAWLHRQVMRKPRPPSGGATACACPRFIRTPGMAHAPRSAASSDHRIRATSSRLANVTINWRKSGPNGPGIAT